MTFESETLEPPNADLCTPGEPVGAVELRRAVENGRASFPQLFKAYWLAERHGPHPVGCVGRRVLLIEARP